MIRGLNPAWLEEPVHWRNVPRGLREVRQKAAVPIAAGQSELSVFGCYDLLAGESVDVINVTSNRGGGITAWMKIAGAAALADVAMAHVAEPHIAMHLMAAIPTTRPSSNAIPTSAATRSGPISTRIGPRSRTATSRYPTFRGSACASTPTRSKNTPGDPGSEDGDNGADEARAATSAPPSLAEMMSRSTSMIVWAMLTLRNCRKCRLSRSSRGRDAYRSKFSAGGDFNRKLVLLLSAMIRNLPDCVPDVLRRGRNRVVYRHHPHPDPAGENLRQHLVGDFTGPGGGLDPADGAEKGKAGTIQPMNPRLLWPVRSDRCFPAAMPTPARHRNILFGLY